MAESRPGRGADQFIVRFPEGLRDTLKAAADKNGRSMNAEIVALLQTGLMAADMAEKVEQSNANIKALEAKMAADREHYERNMHEAATLLAPVTERAEEYKRLFFGQVHVYQSNIANFRSICRFIIGYGEEIPSELSDLAADMLELYNKKYQDSWNDLGKAIAADSFAAPADWDDEDDDGTSSD